MSAERTQERESSSQTKTPSRKRKEGNAQQTPKIKRKLVVLLGFAGALLLVLILRLAQVTLVPGAEVLQKARSQWTRQSNLAAQRGKITDRNGLVLAQSGTSYRVLLNPQAIAEEDRVRVAVEVSDVLGLDYDYVYTRVCNVRRSQIQLKRQVESSVVDQLTALQLGNAISFSTDTKRYYPFNQMFAQILGFTGIDGEGQTGMEAQLDKYLAGKPGLLVAEVDRKNRLLAYGSETYIAPTDGFDAKLTVDSVTQSYLEEQVEACHERNRCQTTTGIVMNPKTGEVLAMTTYPSFDLNHPPRDTVTELMSMSRNRAVTNTYEPGSMFEVIVLAAAIDSGTISPTSTFTCSGSKTFRLERVRCWNTRGHGNQTLSQAVQNSCDCAFMEIAESLGVNRLYDYIYAFGFDKKTDVGLPQEDSGEVIHRKYIRSSDLARLACGKTIFCNALQMANAFCAAVNGGILMKPFLVESVTDQEGNVVEQNEPTEIRRVISASASATVRQLLADAVSGGGGNNASIPGYIVGGKNGWAPITEKSGADSRTRMTATFAGFLPYRDPELVCMILLDEPQIPMTYGKYAAGYWTGETLRNLSQYYGYLADTSTETWEVPNVVGMSGEEGRYEVSKNFEVDVLEEEMAASVIASVPPGGKRVTRHSRVLLYTNMTNFNDSGIYRELSEVPNLIGRRRQDAFDVLTKAGLKLNFDKNVCTGVIQTQSVEAGTRVEPGMEIFVTFPTPTPKLDENGNPVATPAPED